MVKGWIEKPFGELFDFSGGLSASRADLSTNGYPYLHYGDIHGSTKTFVDVCVDKSIPQLDVDLNKVSNASLLNDGDVVFVDASEDDEGSSRHIVVRNTDGIPFISGLHTIIAKAKTDDLDNWFKEFCFQTAEIKSQFKYYAVGTKVTGVSKSTIGKIILVFPKDKLEQHRIAAALSDTDECIIELEKLIAKKRNIKQGAMQELLTGKRRLQGFSGEWVEKRVSGFGDVITGSTPSTSMDEYWNGGIPWVTPTDITDKKDIYTTERMITVEGLSVIRRLPADTLLITCIASIGKNVVLRNIGASNQQINAIIPNAYNDVDFLYYLFEMNKLYMLGKAGQTATNIISKQDFSELSFIVPEKTEQTAIATILSDMDVEIDVLTAKLAKLKHIKQGMMSELLTGRIRLMEQEAKVTFDAKIVELPKQNPKTVTTQTDGHNQQFDDAVMIAGIVDVLYSDKYPLGRKKVQKSLYLLRRHQDASTAAFKKKAAGPYADKVRYKGGEPIARNAKYITTTTTKGKGTIFARGNKISQALSYINSWGKQDDINWVAKNLKYRSGDDLELLATVDMAICDLKKAGIAVSIDSIKHLIETNAEWQAKLKRQTFSDENITRAIQWSNKLFGTEAKPQ